MSNPGMNNLSPEEALNIAVAIATPVKTNTLDEILSQPVYSEGVLNVGPGVEVSQPRHGMSSEAMGRVAALQDATGVATESSGSAVESREPHKYGAEAAQWALSVGQSIGEMRVRAQEDYTLAA